METSLHRQLKNMFAGEDARVEVRLGNFRIDAVVGDELIEIQHGSLGAIRKKIAKLLLTHDVRVVKPIVASKTLVKRKRKNGKVAERRMSPKRGRLLDLFDELIYFTDVFPHPRLTLDVALVEVEEWRYPGHGRRRRWRANDFQVEDQKLVSVIDSHRLQTADDLLALLNCDLPTTFHTGDLAAGLCIPRPLAQRIAYCLREMQIAHSVGKKGNAFLYELAKRRKAA